MTQPLGRATVEIDADTTKLKQGVQKANTEVKKLEKSGKGMGQAMQKAQVVMSKLLVPLAIAGTLGAIATKVMSIITSTQRLRKEFDALGADARKVSESIRLQGFDADSRKAIQTIKQFEAIADKAREKAKEFKETQTGYWLEFFNITDAEQGLQDALANIAAAQKDAFKELAATRIRQEQDVAKARVEATRKAVDDIMGMAVDAEIDLLPDEQKIEARLQRTMDLIRDGLAEAGQLDDKKIQISLGWYERFLRAKADKDQKELTERTTREETAETEKAERVAKASADALIREMERAAATINASFGFNFNGLDQVAAAIDRHAATGGRRF